MSRLRTTYGMILDAQAAAERADELVESAGVLLADAVLDGLDVTLYIETYRRAKAQRTLASAVLNGTRDDWNEDLAAVPA